MTDTPTRRRAPGMSTEQRREMIVQAALPLLASHGTALTTAEVARAAGIGEATVFRAFRDKDELLATCLAAALRNDHVLAELDAIPLDQPLADRLTEAADAVRAHLTRVGTVLAALHATGGEKAGAQEAGTSRPERTRRPDPGSGRQEATARTRQAVMRLLHPDREGLRLPVEQAADVFLTLLQPNRGGTAVEVGTLVDVFLHGAATPNRRPSGASS